MRHILCFARAYFLCYNIDNEGGKDMNLDYKNFAVVYEPEIDAMVAKLDKSGIFDGQTLRLQADCHVGKGCAVGTSLTYTDKIRDKIYGHN